MAKIIELPKLSPTMEEGTLVRWARREGDRVDVDDLLAEVETDKATMEFRSFDRGTVLKLLAVEGQTVRLGAPVAIFGQPGEDISSLLDSVGSATAPVAASGATGSAEQRSLTTESPAAVTLGDGDRVAAGETREPARRVGAPAPAIAPSRPGIAGTLLLPVPPTELRAGDAGETTGRGRTSPRVRRVARERGVSLDRVRATGPSGRVTVDDVARAAAGPAASDATSLTERPADTVRAASQMRKTIARRLTEAKRDVPHFYLEADVDIGALLALREEVNADVEKPDRVSVTDLLLRACALALREVPESNVSWIDGSIVEHHRVDISLAVAIEDGLVTPVIRDADRKTVRQIAAEARELAERARARKLRLEEMQDGVFSLSNLGMYQVDRFSAVINPPESMILAVGASRDVPSVRDGQIVAGRRCALTLSCDHRAVDGALGARFLRSLRGFVERPVRILA